LRKIKDMFLKYFLKNLLFFLGWARPEYDLLHLGWAQLSRVGCPDDPARSNHGLVTVHEHQSIN